MEKQGVTEREALSIKIRSTAEFHYGTLCDLAQTRLEGLVSQEIIEVVKRDIRNEWNRALRVVDNHLEYVNVTRNNAAEPINKGRVIRKVQAKAHG